MVMITECEFAKVYNDYYLKFVQFLSNIIGPNDAEDTAQDVFNKVYSNPGGFKEKSKLSTWIYRIATNTAIDRLRSASYKHSKAHSTLEDSKEKIGTKLLLIS